MPTRQPAPFCTHLLFALAPGALGLVALSVSACARYQAQPVTQDEVDTALRQPDPTQLSVAAAALHHPRLAPVALDPSVPLTPEAAAVIAVLIHPQLRTARAQRGLADAQVIQAGLLPNPQVYGAFDRPITGDTEAAHIGWMVGLSWEVTSFIAHGAKQRSADAANQAVDLAIAWQEWQVATAARQAVVRLGGARERLPFAIEQERVAETTCDLHRRAAAIGAITAEALAQVEATLTDAHVIRLEAEAEVERERLIAVRSIGFPTDHPLPVAALAASGLNDLPVQADQEAVAHLEERRLDLAGLRAGYQSQEETLHAAVLGQFPKITVSLARSRDTSALGLISPGVSIDLPFFDHGQGAIVSATADRERLRAEYIQRVFEARHDLAETFAELHAADLRWRQATSAMQQTTVRAQALHAAADADMADLLAESSVNAEHLRRASEASLWHQRHDELRIAFELTAGSLFPALPALPALPGKKSSTSTLPTHAAEPTP